MFNNHSLFLYKDRTYVIRVDLNNPYRRGNLNRDQMNHKAMSKVRVTNK